MGRWKVSSTSAQELLPSTRGFFLTTSPVPLCSWALSFEIVAGSTSEWWCRRTGYPIVMGVLTLKTRMRTWIFEASGTGLKTSDRTDPIETFDASKPESVIETWSPANAELTGSSSIVRFLTCPCSLDGQTRTLSLMQMWPLAILPDKQNPDPVPLYTSDTDILNGLSIARSGVLKLSKMWAICLFNSYRNLRCIKTYQQHSR